MRRFDADGDGSTYDYKLRYYLTDPLSSPMAIINDIGEVIERISYDAYGRPRHHMPADVNGDGNVNNADQLLLLGNWGNYGVGDIDLSGTVGNSDNLQLSAEWGIMLPDGELSLPEEDNIIGFAGYLYDVEAQVYHVRNRYYDADLGRWLNRDPAGYVDGSNLYLYVVANPLIMFDPMGLWSWNPFDWFGRKGADLEANRRMTERKRYELQRESGNCTLSDQQINAAIDADIVSYLLEVEAEIAAAESEGFQEGAFDGAVGLTAATADAMTFGIGNVGDNIIAEYAIDPQYAEMGRTVGDAAIMTAELVATGGTVTAMRQGAKRGGKEIVERAMSKAELEATLSSGLLRGGRQGTHYVSPAVNSNANRARQRLALDHTPEVRVRMEVPAGRFSEPSRIRPTPVSADRTRGGMPGGGMERSATGDVMVEILEIWYY